jgi:hypothetical protein
MVTLCQFSISARAKSALKRLSREDNELFVGMLLQAIVLVAAVVLFGGRPPHATAHAASAVFKG